MIDSRTAQVWIDRWDHQQQRYIADREERFAVIGDVLAHSVGDDPVIVDLGCGPGSLSARLARRVPRATLIGIDADPLLLGLARAGYTSDRVRFAETDLADSDWPRRAELPATVDAAVSTTALHWLETEDLARLYQTLADRIRPGGVVVNADHLGPDTTNLAELARRVRDARASRLGVTDNEEWGQWWDAVLADPELAGLVDARSRRAISHGGTNGLSAAGHGELLRKAGFAEVGTVWQSGDDQVVVALR